MRHSILTILLLLALSAVAWAQHSHPPLPPGQHPSPPERPAEPPEHDEAAHGEAEPAAEEPGDPHHPAAHAAMPAGPLGIPAARDGSGTSWLPDASPMHALHGRRGDWQLMFHGNAFLYYFDEGGDRGDQDFGSINWAMGMARRPLGAGDVTLRAMLSLEPATVEECGYPVLLATGETCEGGRPIHDRQHPHDLFMELAGLYRRELTAALGVEGYAALSGEPALGPTAFPHRLSALPNPIAPITHHWLDATHISFGVVTAGVFGRRWKAEASRFNGREPDEERWDLDLDALDSFSGRLWWLPGERWALQVSTGHLEEAEAAGPGEERADVDRHTASATYHRPLGDGRLLAATGAWGRNDEEGEETDAVLAEVSLDLDHRHTLFARAEWAEKTGHDLALPDHELEERTFDVGSLLLGWVVQGQARGGWRPGVGAKVSVSFVPDSLGPVYGSRTPFGWGLFASLRPAAGEHGRSQPHGP